MKYIVYILKSRKDSSFYIGYTNNLKRRLFEHNNGLSGYTANKIPWDIHYTEEFDTKSEALKREKFLKRQKNSSFYNSLK